jgi:arylsulfatase A-like enzyme
MPYYHKGHLKAYRKGNYKILFFGGDRTETELQKPLLYDLRQDLAERRDISEDRPDILEDLMQAVESHREQVTVADPIFDRRLNRLSAPGRRAGR